MDDERKAAGETRALIAHEIVRLQSEYCGKGPTRAKTYITDDLVVVVLEKSFTRAEKTLAERGEHEAIGDYSPAFSAAHGRELHQRRRAGDRPQGQRVPLRDGYRRGRVRRDVSCSPS